MVDKRRCCFDIELNKRDLVRGKGTKKSFYQNTVEKRDKVSSLLRRHVRSKVKNILSLCFTLGHKQIYMEYNNE